VKADTPRAEWNGRTWYFCSEECRAKFLADPNHFSPTRGDR
jgi:YHS domain-containing protein